MAIEVLPRSSPHLTIVRMLDRETFHHTTFGVTCSFTFRTSQSTKKSENGTITMSVHKNITIELLDVNDNHLPYTNGPIFFEMSQLAFEEVIQIQFNTSYILSLRQCIIKNFSSNYFCRETLYA